MLEQALRELFEWASERDFMGHDPHDLLSSPILRSVQNPLVRLAALQIGAGRPLICINFFAFQPPKILKLSRFFLMGL